jgi:PPOX class probable F420-dependent enzyme
VGREDDTIIFSTHDKRRKADNLRRDGRVSLTIFDPKDPYQSIDVRGTVELVDDPERRLSYELTQRHLGEEPPADPPGSHRLIGRLTAERITGIAA